MSRFVDSPTQARNSIMCLVLVFFAVLTSCTSGPALKPAPSQPASELDVLHHERQGLTTWKIKGRLAIQAGKEGWTATLHWDQDREQFRIRLIAPLGQGTYELTGDDDGVTMVTADNRVLSASNAGQLLLENLGWEIRLSGLKYWIRGLPEPGIETTQVVFNDAGLISDMQQADWRVSILRYMDTGGIQLPGKLFMQNNRFSVRLAIQEWETVP